MKDTNGLCHEHKLVLLEKLQNRLDLLLNLECLYLQAMSQLSPIARGHLRVPRAGGKISTEGTSMYRYAKC